MLERLLKLLEQERTKLAISAMEAPAQDLFNHGVLVGRYQGFKLAEETIERLLNEADEKDQAFERRFS